MFANLKICMSPFIIETEHLKIMAVILAALVILLMVGVALVYAHQKKQSDKINGTKPVTQHCVQSFFFLYLFIKILVLDKQLIHFTAKNYITTLTSLQ